MSRARLTRVAVVGGLMLTSALALAQQAPESLLPPGFETPPPRARATPRAEPRSEAPARPRAPRTRIAPAQVTTPPAPRAPANPAPAQPAVQASATPVVQPLPQAAGAAPPSVRSVTTSSTGGLPSVDALAAMSPEQLDAVLGQAGAADLALGGSRRSLAQTGIIDESEGGLPADSLSAQDASLIRATIAGNRGRMVSRWGHILLRRALASRLQAPPGMDPADFAAIRAALLVRMGEGDAARALVQDIDPALYSPALSDAAFDAYVATADLAGTCPLIAARPSGRTDPPWQVASAMCDGFRGEGSDALSRLDHALRRGLMPKIDMLLAQKYVGAAGKARRAVTIDWSGVDDMTPWRYGLALAVGLQPPDTVMRGAAPTYGDTAALAPMLGLAARAAAADRAGTDGVLSSAAMIDLYGQIYATNDVTGDWSDRSGTLRDAYVAETLAARVAAMKSLWSDVDDPRSRYARLVLTATAAARLPADEAFAGDADDLIAAMLAAGLDANAARWAGLVKRASIGWAQLAVGSPQPLGGVDGGAIEDFASADRSKDRRKSGFLIAGLAGLDRLSADVANDQASRLDMSLGGATHWTRLIDSAARTGNTELVVLLVGVGMQGDDWNRMTPRFLFHIVSALRAVGLEPEARMIAAEAVARA